MNSQKVRTFSDIYFRKKYALFLEGKKAKSLGGDSLKGQYYRRCLPINLHPYLNLDREVWR